MKKLTLILVWCMMALVIFTACGSTTSTTTMVETTVVTTTAKETTTAEATTTATETTTVVETTTTVPETTAESLPQLGVWGYLDDEEIFFEQTEASFEEPNIYWFYSYEGGDTDGRKFWIDILSEVMQGGTCFDTSQDPSLTPSGFSSVGNRNVSFGYSRGYPDVFYSFESGSSWILTIDEYDGHYISGNITGTFDSMPIDVQYCLTLDMEDLKASGQLPSDGGDVSSDDPDYMPVVCDKCYGGTCPNCNGIGYKLCQRKSCNGGKCGFCGGTGTNLTTGKRCTVCHNGDCTTCGGDGRIECIHCDGSGECPYCDGLGFTMERQ